MLAELRKAAGLSQQALGDRLGVNQDWIHHREKGTVRIKATDRERLARALGIPEEALVPDPRGASLANLGLLIAKPMGKVKVYGLISAGDGNTSSYDPAEAEVPIELCRPDFGALVIEGDSMMDFLHPKDLAIFKDWRAEKLGHVVAAELPDGSWVSKLMVFENGAFKLRSLNAKYPDIEPPFRVAGFLVGLVRDDGPERTIRLNPFGLKP